MNERELLRELLRLLDQSEHCDTCIGPSDAFEGRHAENYVALRKRARRLLAKVDHGPN